MMAQEFDRDTILRLLTELGRRLHEEGLFMHIYLVGGAAMALTYDNRRVTRDIDGLFDHSDIELSIIHQMAIEHGLPEDWLNTAARPYVPGDDRLATTLDITGLGISTASPQHMLAMKMAAFRPQDHKDLRLLFGANGISSAQQAVDVVFSVYGPDYATMFGSREDYLLRAESILHQIEIEKEKETPDGGAGFSIHP